MRVVIMKEFIQMSFPETPILNYALEVEQITTAKVTQNNRLENLSFNQTL